MALLGALVLSPLCGLAADADAPKKYALLVAVTKYEHAEMNRPQPLEFPEADAVALAAVLRAADYTTEVLAGPQATKERIEAGLAGLKRQGNDSGAVMVAFFWARRGAGRDSEQQGRRRIVFLSLRCIVAVSPRCAGTRSAGG